MPKICFSPIKSILSLAFLGHLLLVSAKYVTIEKGTPHTLGHRLFIRDEGTKQLISPWHDIPLRVHGKKDTFHMVVEIPRWTQAKMEMSTKEQMSPIKQDVNKEGHMRFVHNIYPFHGYIWNYGALPQTWEDPNKKDSDTNAIGDNDPIDVVEIGSKIHASGSIVEVKILGVLGLIDDKETDWKLVAIDVKDELASKLDCMDDVEREMPGLRDDTIRWFRNYKLPTSAKMEPNEFAMDGGFQTRAFALKKIEETHKHWLELIKEAKPELNTECHLPSAVHKANDVEWRGKLANMPMGGGQPADMPEDFEKWHFIEDKPSNVEFPLEEEESIAAKL